MIQNKQRKFMLYKNIIFKDFLVLLRKVKKLSFCHEIKCIIPISLQPDGVCPWYFKLSKVRICSLLYQRITTSGCKDIGIAKSEFVEKIQFLWKQF